LPIANCQYEEIGNWQLEIGNALPARLNHARDLPLQRQLAKTDAAQIEFPQITSRPAATLASSVSAHRKFRFSRRLRNQ